VIFQPEPTARILLEIAMFEIAMIGIGGAIFAAAAAYIYACERL
jgi:hypothetical protein